jgi:hypothetical protein
VFCAEENKRKKIEKPMIIQKRAKDILSISARPQH